MNPRGYYKGRTWSLHVNTIVSFCLFVVFHKKGGFEVLIFRLESEVYLFPRTQNSAQKKTYLRTHETDPQSQFIIIFVCFVCLTFPGVIQ